MHKCDGAHVYMLVSFVAIWTVGVGGWWERKPLHGYGASGYGRLARTYTYY